MSQILTYVKLNFKLMFKKDKKADAKSNAITLVVGLLTCAVLLILFKYLFDIINKQLLSHISAQKFAILITLIIEVVLLFFCVFFEIKFFLKPSDVLITARLPLSAKQLFISHLLIVYVYLLGVSILLFSAVMIIFGASAGIISVGFVARLLLASLFAPIMPFALATLVVVPIMYLLILLENKNVLKLILFLLILGTAFVLYSSFLNFLAEYYIHQRVDSSNAEIIFNFINKLDNGWNIFAYLNNIIFGTQMLKSFGVILSVGLVVSAIAILIFIPVYSQVRNNDLEGRQRIFYKSTKMTQDSAFVAIFKNQFKNIMRTHTYAFFFLGIAIITPIMVFLTNRLIQKIGTAQIGNGIVLGVSLITMLVFMCIINSFSASAISREGKEFYITKIVPVNYKVQLLAKGLLNALVAVGALIVSTIILCSMKFISPAQGLVVFVVSLIVTVGLIFNGFNINLGYPNINKQGYGKESQTNSTLTMGIGYIVSGLIGIISIVLNFFMKEHFIYLIIIAIALFYTIVNVLVFHFTANKRYAKIE